MKQSYLNIAASLWPTAADETIREKNGLSYKLFSTSVVGTYYLRGQSIYDEKPLFRHKWEETEAGEANRTTC